MYSHYLPDDDHLYRYSFKPKRYVPLYPVNLNNGYDDDEFSSENNGYRAKFTTTTDFNNSFINKDEFYIRKNGDFYMTNRSYSNIDPTDYNDDKVNKNKLFFLLVT